ncbi:MAG TPA: protein kinase [Polyangiaceae bacterium]|nr:protein kinase [Polyangiaceae bacterium]
MGSPQTLPSAPGLLIATPREGDTIRQYEIIRELGSGGMGAVFLARDNRLGRRVAIKFLNTNKSTDIYRFLDEAQATARCCHENIVVIYEVGEHHGTPFMVLEYLQGGTLAQFRQATPPLAPARVVEVMASVVRALACAHEQGIIHRDLKPENIMLTDAGSVKVLDFGIAKVLKPEPSNQASSEAETESDGAPAQHTRRGAVIGSLLYMSPEQWEPGCAVDHRADIWAVGLILFEILAGKHPLSGVGPNPGLWVSNLDLEMPRLHEAAPDVPKPLADVVDACLRKRREERISDAQALLRALEPFLPGRFTREYVTPMADPYAGLRSFQEEEASRFFGRADEIAALLARLRDWPLLAAVGPSGIGKSSLVRAGVIPALKSSGEPWEVLVARPGRDPLRALASLLAPLASPSSTVADDLGALQALSERLSEEPGYFGAALRSRCQRGNHRMLVFVDQFEELYTLGAEQSARRDFTTCLAAAADDATSPVRVMVSLRSDFLGRVTEDPSFMNELNRGIYLVGPPSAQGLRAALVQPAEMAGYRFEAPAMVDQMIQYLEATPGALPLLQFTASQLWQLRDADRKLLSSRSYQSLGGIAGALVNHADRVVAQLSPEHQTLCRSLFLRLVTPERTRAIRELDELRDAAGDWDELKRLIDYLVEMRLLLIWTSESNGQSRVEIVHESLIANWPTLQGWLDDSQEDSIFLEQLQVAARQWHAKSHDAGLLWGGAMVGELRRFQGRLELRYGTELADPVRAFVLAVFAQYERGKRARRKLFVAAAAGVVGALVLVAAVVALLIVRKAQEQAEANAAAMFAAKEDAVRAKDAAVRARDEAEHAKARELAAKEALADELRRKMGREEQLIRKTSELELQKERAAYAAESAHLARLEAEKNRQQAEDATRKAESSEREIRQENMKKDHLVRELQKHIGVLAEPNEL